MPSGVEFDEDNMGFRRPVPGGGFSQGRGFQSQQTGMAGWLMRKGWVKTSSGAQIVLVVIVIVNVIITYVLIKFFI